MKNVMLKITGKIVSFEKGQEVSEDVMEFITEGQIQSRGRTTMFVYPEMEETGLGNCITYVTASPNKVRVRRDNEDGGNDAETVMEFEKGKRFNGLYLSPYGPMGMEILTNDIENTLSDGKKKLSIDYSMSLKGISETRNKLDIEVIRELEGENNEQKAAKS